MGEEDSVPKRTDPNEAKHVDAIKAQKFFVVANVPALTRVTCSPYTYGHSGARGGGEQLLRLVRLL